MNELGMKDALENIARAGVPEKINLWPEIEALLNKRRSFVRTLRARPLLTILVVLLIILLLTGAAYAVGLLTGYIPGIGFVQTNDLRVLAEPVSQTRQGVAVTIEQVVVDTQRTVLAYKTEDLPSLPLIQKAKVPLLVHQPHCDCQMEKLCKRHRKSVMTAHLNR